MLYDQGRGRSVLYTLALLCALYTGRCYVCPCTPREAAVMAVSCLCHYVLLCAAVYVLPCVRAVCVCRVCLCVRRVCRKVVSHMRALALTLALTLVDR